MAEITDRFPKWHEPATKGDVVAAMIWTSSMTMRLYSLTLSSHSNDAAKFSEAIEAFDAEYADFRRKMYEIGGGDVNAG